MKALHALVLVGLVFSAPLALSAQPAPQGPPPRPVITTYMPQVDNLDRAETFYHGLIGLESIQGDPRARLGWYPGNPFLNDMYGVAGNIRNFYLRVPQTELTVEPIQWSEAKGKPLSPRLQDPGASRLVLAVNDIDALAKYLAAGRATVVTAGGKPVTVREGGNEYRVLVVKDFNGFFVELVQPVPLPAAAPGAAPPTYFISGANIALTVEDIDKAAAFYRDVLGLEVRVEPAFAADAQHLAAFGMSRAQYRQASVVWPDKTPQIRLIEFKDIDRQPITPLVPEPNATVIRINIRDDMNTAVAKVKASGARIMNLSGGPYTNGATQWLMVAGPGGVYHQLVAPTPAGAQ